MANLDDLKQWVSDVQDFLYPLSFENKEAECLGQSIPKMLEVFDQFDIVPLNSSDEFEECPVCGATASNNCIVPCSSNIELTDMVHRKRLKL